MSEPTSAAANVTNSIAALLLLLLLVLPWPVTAIEIGAERKEWSFDVYLDDARIGYHKFHLTEGSGGVLELEAEAQFDVKFLFFNAFRYRHEIQETWSGDCLVGVDARTDNNGDLIEVEGQLTDAGFTVAKAGETRRLEPCVMTFAYWNPAFLDQPRLLNPQTGEYVAVEVESLGKAVVELGSRAVPATGYRVVAQDVEVVVWYGADDDRWIALESPAKGGRVIRYELSI